MHFLGKEGKQKAKEKDVDNESASERERKKRKTIFACRGSRCVKHQTFSLLIGRSTTAVPHW